MFLKHSPTRWFHVFISIILCFLLALALVPLGSVRTASALSNRQSQTKEDIASLLAAGDYAEGEAIVIVDETVSGDSSRVRGVDALAGSEPLMMVSEDVFEAVQEASHASTQTQPQNEALSALSAGNEEAVSIRSVVSTALSTEELLYALQQDPRVLLAEPNYTHQLDIQRGEGVGGQEALDVSKIADMTDYQWGNRNTNKTLMTPEKSLNLDFDISPPSWETSRTDSSMKNAKGTVAVVDTGIDYNHPDLKNIMRNDMTNYVSYGGAYGYTAYEGYDPTDPMDDHSHGTHCAGIIAAEWNEYGISGVTSGVKLVAVKAGNADGSISTRAVVKGYAYLAEAMKNGLNLKAVNNSWGGPDTSQAFSLAAMQLGQLGAISVVSSGNDSTNVDYAANTGSTLNANPYAVVVNSATMNATLSSFSNYGQATTDIVAPGSTILSTIPLDMSNYMPEAIESNLVFESFSSDSGPYKFATSKTEDMSDLKGSRATNYYLDADGASWSIKVEDMVEEVREGLVLYRAFATLDIPQAQQNQARYLGFSAYSTGGAGFAQVGVSVVAKKEGEETSKITGMATHDRGGWRYCLADLSVDSGGNPVSPLYEGNKLPLVITLFSENNDINADTDILYLDAIGLGAEDALVPYDYKNGTSMATPAAVGAAMVLANDEDSALDASAAALARAQRLAGLVRPVDAFADICTSGGALDLRYLNPPEYTPVLQSATMHTEGGVSELTLSGAFFGTTEGSVTVGGKTAEVKSGTWTDTAVSVIIPDGLVTGVHTVVLTAADPARAGQKAFYLTLPDSPDFQETPLFEREYSLPSAEEGFTSDFMKTALVGLGGYLYAAFADGDGFTSTMWRLNPGSGMWTRCADLPETLYGVSATSYKGRLAVAGSGPEDDTISLLFYDSQTDSWEYSDQIASIPAGATIANWNENLLFSGGYKGEDAFENIIYADTVFIYNPDTKRAEQIGSLRKGLMNPSVAVHENVLMVTGTVYGKTNEEAELISLPSGGSKDITSALPVFTQDREHHYAVAPVAEGFVLTGASAAGQSLRSSGIEPVEDQDTYTLDVSLVNQGESFKALDKRVSYSQLFQVSAAAYRGALYTFGTSYYEKGAYILRATAIETLDQPGDLYTVAYYNVNEGEYNNGAVYTPSALPLNLAPVRDRQQERFAGWYSNAEFSGSPVTTIAAGTTGDLAFWAKWEPANSKPSALTTTGDSLLIKSFAGALLLVVLISLGAIGMAARRKKKRIFMAKE